MKTLINNLKKDINISYKMHERIYKVSKSLASYLQTNQKPEILISQLTKLKTLLFDQM